MKPLLRNLAVAAAVVAMTVTTGGVPNSTALAQTAAPSAAVSLPEATVKALQEALNKEGIAVKTDGVLGNDTRAAIRQYQTQHHLTVTGEPDKATLDKLGIAGQKSEGPSGQQPAGTPGMMGGQDMMGKGGTPGFMGGQDMMGKGGMPGTTGNRP